MTRGLHYVRLGRLAVCWRDAWSDLPGLEVSWNDKALIHRGFSGPPRPGSVEARAAMRRDADDFLRWRQ